MSSGKAIGSRVIKNKSISAAPTARLKTKEDEAQEQISRSIARRELKSLTDVLAGHTFYYRNWMIPNCKDFFPRDPNLWSVMRYYPHAEGGPIAFDLPQTELERGFAEQKRAAFAQLKIRFYVIDDKKTLEMMQFEVGSGASA